MSVSDNVQIGHQSLSSNELNSAPPSIKHPVYIAEPEHHSKYGSWWQIIVDEGQCIRKIIAVGMYESTARWLITVLNRIPYRHNSCSTLRNEVNQHNKDNI